MFQAVIYISKVVSNNRKMEVIKKKIYSDIIYLGKIYIYIEEKEKRENIQNERDLQIKLK